MEIWFGEGILYVREKCTGLTSPVEHINTCSTMWKDIPKKEWVHMFIHTLDLIPRNWYMSLELWRGTAEWDELARNFKQTFSYEDEIPMMDAALKVIKVNIFA